MTTEVEQYKENGSAEAGPDKKEDDLIERLMARLRDPELDRLRLLVRKWKRQEELVCQCLFCRLGRFLKSLVGHQSQQPLRRS